MTNDLDDDVRAFHKKFGHPAPKFAVLPSDEVRAFRVKLIQEECHELCEALGRGSLSDIAAEAIDLLYVVIGTLVVCGLKVRPFWSLVQSANMMKIPNPDGGKPLKPAGWTKPDCAGLIKTIRTLQP